MNSGYGEIMMAWGVRLMAFISVLSVGAIGFFIFFKGVPPIFEIGVHEFLFGVDWRPGDVPPSYGIFTMIVGSIAVTAGALLIGGPIGIAAALCLSFFTTTKVHRILRSLVLLLAGIPSIVYGFFGMTVLVPMVREYFGGSGNSLLTAAILLGIMILPTVVSVSESSLSALPHAYYEAGRALGLSNERTVVGIMLPAASGGVLASLVLGVGRAIGETMAVIMVAGNHAMIPTSVLNGTRTLTANIVLEMGYAADLHRDALISSGTVLFLMILVINSIFLYIRGKWGNAGE